MNVHEREIERIITSAQQRTATKAITTRANIKLKGHAHVSQYIIILASLVTCPSFVKLAIIYNMLNENMDDTLNINI